jgi:hypothetical protein
MWIKYSDGDILSTAGDALTSDAGRHEPYFKWRSKTLETHQRRSWRQVPTCIDYMPIWGRKVLVRFCVTSALTKVGLNILEFVKNKTFNI